MRSYRNSSRLAAVVAALAIAACSKYVKDDKPYKTIKSRSSYQVNPARLVEVVDDGVLVSVSCTREVVELYCEKRNQLTSKCDGEDKRAHTEASVCKSPLPPATLSFAWAPESTGVKQSDTAVLFPIDWAAARVNPLGADVIAEVRQEAVVRIGGEEARVALDESAARRAIENVARRSTIDMSVATESRDVALAVESLAVADGELTAGEANALIITVRNRGPGVAYRVSAVLSSSVPGLHRQGAAIGKLAPDESATVKIPVQVAADVTDKSAMVVVKLSEHNHPQQRGHSQRFRIVASAVTAIDADLSCEVAANDADAVVVAGKQARVICAVTNRNDKRLLVDAELSATMNGTSKTVRLDKAIEPGRRHRVSLELTVPVDAEGDTAVKVTLSGPGVKSISATVNTKVASGLCGGKKLTQEEYRAKRDKLEKAFQAGAMSAQEFDKFDAELVSCLK